MKLIQIAKRGPDKLLAGFALNSATRGQDNRVHTVRIWFSETIDSGDSRYCVEMDRTDANRLRDFLNTTLPEAADELPMYLERQRKAESGPDISPAMIDKLAWKGGEYHYCVSLCRSAGNAAVPPPSVKDYLFLQSCLADKAGETSLSIALWGGAEILDKHPGRFSKAFVFLVEQRDRIAKESEA